MLNKASPERAVRASRTAIACNAEFRKRRREFRHLPSVVKNNELAMKVPKEDSYRSLQVRGDGLRKLRGAAGWTLGTAVLLYLLLAAAAGVPGLSAAPDWS